MVYKLDEWITCQGLKGDHDHAARRELSRHHSAPTASRVRAVKGEPNTGS